MATYNPFVRGSPDGSTGTGTTFSTAANVNDAALQDFIVAGQAAGFAMSVAGGTAAQPATMTWANGSYKIRASITWGTTGGEDGQLKAIDWEQSTDNGATWNTPKIAAQTATYDASGNLLTTTNAGGFVSWLMALIGKLKQHIASTSAHGVGTMAAQAASAVAITGGTVAGAAITTSTASLTYEREVKVAKGNVAGSTSLDWATAGLFTATITNAAGTFTHANLPSGSVGFITLDVTNPGVATTLLSGVKWPGGTIPSFTAAGRDIVVLMCHDGATISGSMTKDVR